MGAYQVIGKELSNDQAVGKVSGALRYCSDLPAVRTKGLLYMRLKLSELAHGRIRHIDTAAAEALAGVRAVYTWENTPSRLYDRGRVEAWECVPNQERLFDPHVRFFGERVAAVVADTEEIAEEACRLIQVSYETLPAAITTEEAKRTDAPKLHEKGNIYPVPSFDYGDFSKAQGVYRHESCSHIGRMTHLTLETQSCLASFDPSAGRLTVYSGCQTVFGVRSTVAEFLDMPYAKVRVVKTPMGGSFGVRQETLLEPLTAYAAKDLEADVRLVYTREEQIRCTMMKHSLDAQVQSKVDAEGRIQGVSVRCELDAGAYLTVSESYAETIGAKLGKVYRIPNLHYEGQAVCTNTPINGSFRSWGSCEQTLMMENHWNMVARDLGMDPIAFRMKNILRPYEKNICHNVSVEHVHFEECLKLGSERFEWEERRRRCEEKNWEQRRFRYGVGMALSSHTSSFYPYRVDISSASARLQEDGSLIVHVGIHDHGCGTVMAMKKIAAEVMELGLDKIELNEADTQISLYDYGCYASRTVYSLGKAVKACCEALLEKAKEVACAALSAAPSALRYREGRFYCDTDAALQIELAALMQHAIHVMGRDVYAAVTVNASENPGVSAAHFTEVAVDTYTGFTRILHCLSVHDVGKAINPDLCRGQIGSGIQQGIGMALCEEIKIHPQTGETLIPNLKNYEVANIADMPDYDVLLIEEGEPTGPFGAKSIGEVAVAAVAPAIVAAVNTALGTNLTRLPLTPAVILEEWERKSNEN